MMEMTAKPFRVGHCANCITQTWVMTSSGRPIKALEGSYLVWLVLCDKQGSPKTRIGSVTLCPKCLPTAVNPEDIANNLIAEPLSGFHGEEIESQRFPLKKIEVIKRYGD